MKMCKKPVRVCHLTSVHSATDPRIFHKECKSLARAGFSVSVIGPNPGATADDAVIVQPIRKDKTRLARMTRTVWRVYAAAVKEDAHVYHFHDPELIPVGLLLKARRKQVIYDIHEDLPKDVMSKHYLPRWSRSVVSALSGFIEQTACGQFSALVAVTPSIAARVQSRNRHTIVVHNYPYAKELVYGEPLVPWSLRRNSVAYVGGIMVQRAIREMVTAMTLLPESLGVTLELAGPEILDPAVADELRCSEGWKRVHHFGFIDQPSTFSLLRSVRAGLVLFHPEPNHLEAIPQKIFEYMGAGLPVIASDFPLWRRIIGESGCGIFVDPTKPEQIAQAIRDVLTHPREAEAMGRRGQAAVLERFNWDSEAAKLVKLYRELGEKVCAA